MVVDSCIDLSGQPAALGYLQLLGIDPRQAIKLILATHWHDDHIRGLARIVQVCERTPFYCSAALRHDEFFRLVGIEATDPISRTSPGVREFAEIVNLLTSRSRTRDNEATELHWCLEDRVLRPRTIVPPSEGPTLVIRALSPSDKAVTLSKQRLGRLLPQSRTRAQRRLPSLDPNDTSVVLLIAQGETSVLLGADLECTGDSNTGWEAIIARGPLSPSPTIFKVPHHGSENAHLDDLWVVALARDPVALLTPYTLGAKYLPLPDHVERICSHTSRGYATSLQPKGCPAVARDTTVASTLMSQVARKRDAEPLRVGHIRVRKNLQEPRSAERVELFDGAASLLDYLKTNELRLAPRDAPGSSSGT